MNFMESTQDVQTPVMQALQWRYATKKFDTTRKIPEGVVQNLLEVLRLAPSSMGLQPYRFIHVRDAELRTKLKAESFDQAQITDASELIVFAAKTEYNDKDIEAFLQASQQARGYTDEAIEKRRKGIENHVGKFDPQELVQWNARQAYIAIGQLLTAAAVMGIDACPMEGIKAGPYSDILGLDALGLKPLAVVTLGFRSEDDQLASDAKIRLPLDTLVLTR